MGILRETNKQKIIIIPNKVLEALIYLVQQVALVHSNKGLFWLCDTRDVLL